MAVMKEELEKRMAEVGLITVREASDEYGIPTSTISGWAQRGLVAALKLDVCYFVARHDVERMALSAPERVARVAAMRAGLPERRMPAPEPARRISVPDQHSQIAPTWLNGDEMYTLVKRAARDALAEAFGSAPAQSDPDAGGKEAAHG